MIDKKNSDLVEKKQFALRYLLHSLTFVCVLLGFYVAVTSGWRNFNGYGTMPPSEWEESLNAALKSSNHLKTENVISFSLGTFADKRQVWQIPDGSDFFAEFVSRNRLTKSNTGHSMFNILLDSIPSNFRRPSQDNCDVYVSVKFDRTRIEGEELYLLVFDKNTKTATVLFHRNF